MQVIDSHTEGEPTRVIVSGGPDLGTGSLTERLIRFREQADCYREFAVNEPRGWEAIVGALLCEPNDPSCDAGVIFFNNVGYLGMCGHGMIGVAVTLHYLGRIGLGIQRIETPVGVVTVDVVGANEVTIENVPSYRLRKNVRVEVDGIGTVEGDVAWGGNWFFMVHGSPVPLKRENLDELVLLSRRVSAALAAQGHTGENGAVIDHVEFAIESATAPVDGEGCNSVNFVLCPGGIYDRSPCGTGTSAKLACLAADGTLLPNEQWTQDSVTGGRFRASYRPGASLPDGKETIVAKITGRSFICGETTLINQEGDPFGQPVEEGQVSELGQALKVKEGSGANSMGADHAS
ncbi:proline racemase family protein [Neorhodopirellula lusitana]|uniref:proline racemase family protein n=1 Tax=Neorhodopirellula lusitana TaxID=445327 RepID=UPI00384BD285